VVPEAMVFKAFFDYVDPAKAMYGTDLPITVMRGRRVCIYGAWVDELKPIFFENGMRLIREVQTNIGS
jgi:hypothetical protein